jgi:hypothetical protein
LNDVYSMKKSITIFTVFLAIATSLHAYETMQEKTPVGEIKILKLPARLALEADSQTSYFQADNGLFRKLFRYINAKGVSMTTPVEAEINPGKMRFFVGKGDRLKNINSTTEVKVKKIPPVVVLAIGIRGSYSENRFRENEKLLISQIKINKEYEAIGKAYAVYWNGPFVPGFFKRSEVHLPIRKKNELKRKTKVEI